MLLGYILEDVTRNSYASELDRRIVKPLSLRNTTAKFSEPARNDALAYTFKGGEWQAINANTHPTNASGAGGIVSTAEDVNAFLHALFTGRVISPGSLEKMTTHRVITRNDMAMGIDRMAFNNKSKIGFTYDGQIDAVGSVYFYVPPDRLAVSILTNGENYPSGEIFWSVMRVLYGAPLAISSFKVIQLPSEKLGQFEGTYTLAGSELKAVVKREGNDLVIMIDGESKMKLTARGETNFEYAPDGVLVDFTVGEDASVTQLSLYLER